MDRGAWWAAVHGVTKSQTRLSNFTFTFHFHALEKEMATHSSVLAWRIPGTAKPGGLPSMGLHRVRHDWSDLAVAALPSPLSCVSQHPIPFCKPDTAEHTKFMFYLMVLKKKFFLYDIVDLQCCVSPRCTVKWLHYWYTYSYPFSIISQNRPL